MREEDKKEYLDRYEEEKKRGIPFFPDALFKDAVVALGIFIILIALSALVGAALGDRVDPSVEFDPEPEWYFLFLFQLLKYFPGSLEFIGAVVLPVIVIVALFALPWLDRSRKRHFTGRPLVLVVTSLLAVGTVALTVFALVEQAPPAGAEAAGDTVALLYTENCSGCHGATMVVAESTDLAQVISAGGHEGMPAWSADLSVDEIDALAGFILSPRGHEIFGNTCAECHEVASLVEASPFDLRSALNNGNTFAAHANVSLPQSIASLEKRDATALLNFLSAPDGQRLFTANCSACHGSAVAFAGTAEELRVVIETGGKHVDMPAMGGVLSDEEISLLAEYVVAPNTSSDEAKELFAQNCTVCHGSRVPTASSVEAARDIIATGGGHQTMPVWGEILTPEQLDALTVYAMDSARGTPVIAGQALFAEQCATCHGEFGEGGVNPANEAIVIAPISTASYLQTRDDVTIRNVIARGQPDLGMSPFSLEFGGALDEDDITSLVAFIRAWEADPPVDLPPDIERAPLLGDAHEVFAEFCSQCHGPQGEGGIGPSFQDPAFHSGISDAEILTAIDLGHPATAMIGWGRVLTDGQMEDLVTFIRRLEVEEASVANVSRFSQDVLPIFEENCKTCHGSLGGWNSESYETVMTTGNSAPVVIPGDPDRSLLVELLTDPSRRTMPPGGMLPERQIQVIIDWITSGAANN